MSPIIPLMLLGGTVLILTNRKGGSRKEDDAAPPGPGPAVAPPGGAPGPGPAKLPPASTNDGTCIQPEQKDLSSLPEDPFWNAFRYAMLMDSNPTTLREFAASCKAVCQPTAAKALEDKAKALEDAGVPPGFNPNGTTLPGLPSTFTVPGLPGSIAVPTGYDPTGMWTGFPTEAPELVVFPVPGIEGSPEPKYPVPDAAPGLPNITPEQAPKGEVWKDKPGIRTWARTQWWSGPLRAGESPWNLARKVTGDGRRYPELMPANPEKATVGKPGSAGYTFASFKIGERVRLPKGWNIYIDQTGKTDGKGTIWPADPAEPSTTI